MTSTANRRPVTNASRTRAAFQARRAAATPANDHHNRGSLLTGWSSPRARRASVKTSGRESGSSGERGAEEIGAGSGVVCTEIDAGVGVRLFAPGRLLVLGRQLVRRAGAGRSHEHLPPVGIRQVPAVRP